MSKHYLTAGLTLSICGDEAEVEIDATVKFTKGCPEHYAKDPGMWLPADPPEAELTSAKVGKEDVPDWVFNAIAELDWLEILDMEDAA